MRIMPKLGGRLPGTVVAMLGIPPGERIVAWGASGGSDPTQSLVAVATDRALYLQAEGERVPWEHITKAMWDEPVLELSVTDGSAPARFVRIRLEDARDLPAAVHDRVTASVIVSERLVLGDGAKATAVARRGADDDISWTVVFDAGLDPTDPALRSAADAELARLRDSLGI
jgi:hypothetical protein